jgi:uncharacterized protein YodC (DUF2158 family)
MKSFRPGNLVQHKSGGPIMMVASEPGVGRGDDRYPCVWVENGERRYASFHLSSLQQPLNADGVPLEYKQVAGFVRFTTGGANFNPWVLDTETGLEVQCTTRDTPRGRWTILVYCDSKPVFSFEALVQRDEGKGSIYSAPMEKVRALYRRYASDLRPFNSEGEFIAKLRKGVELMFNHEPYEQRGASVVFDLT